MLFLDSWRLGRIGLGPSSYYASGGPEHASRFVKVRYEVNKKYGVPDEEVAQFDLGVCTALLVNTVPAMAWTLYHAFSSPAILAQLRAGIGYIVFGKGIIGSSLTTPGDIPEIIQGFPFLEALVMEVLCMQSPRSGNPTSPARYSDKMVRTSRRICSRMTRSSSCHHI